MKIELNCACCAERLRVDQEHAGKQVRCPSCQGLSRIPHAGNDKKTGSAEQTSRYSAPMEDWNQPQVFAAPLSSVYQPPQSSGDVVSLVLGIVGICLNIGCSCLFPVWIILNVYGLFLAIRSSGSLRKAGVITNLAALAVSLVMAMVLGFRFWF